MDNETTEKKLPAHSAPARASTSPMTLGNMRSLGLRSLEVTCRACGHHTTFNVDEWPDELTVRTFGPHIGCTKCAHIGASVRPNST